MSRKVETPLSQVAALIAVLAMLCIPGAWATAEGPPRVFLLDAARLQAARVAIAQRDPAVMPAWAALKADADKALVSDRFSVVDKPTTPPSGDKHDYMTQAPYWWPDPKKPDGLPYIRRDGERNPELDKLPDHVAMDRMASAVTTLSLAAYVGNDERYGAKAAQLLRAWFVEPATRMNPSLTYAQFIPGINTGRGIGLIETRGLSRLVDAISLVDSIGALPAADKAALRDWFSRFGTWMRESSHGRDESNAKNNHGTYYDLQVVTFALFVEQPAIARQVLEDARAKRLDAQIEPDGRQPLELARTRSFSYSVMNIDGLTQLATVGDRVGIDLWSYTRKGAKGPAIREALLYLAPYALGDAKWPHQQIGNWDPQSLFPVLRRAVPHYQDAQFRGIVRRVPPAAAADRTVLSQRQPQ
jgi:alginate lyase